MYHLIDWEQTQNGKVPALPPGVGFLMLAEPKNRGQFALFETNLFVDLGEYERIEPVADELRGLLDAAKQYAPALALARDDVAALNAETKADFLACLTGRLRQRLDQQQSAPYLMAKALRTEAGYKHAGDYYWIVGYEPEREGREVAWVSRDYFVYSDSLSDFDVDASVLQVRFNG